MRANRSIVQRWWRSGAEVFLGETPGYFNAELSPEDVHNNWETITGREGYAVPNNLGEETALFMPFFS